jgi:5-methylcytosine-specific restriction endonuclease McrA
MNIANVLELPVLSLNKNWQAYDDKKTVRRAFEDVMSGFGDQSAFLAMDVELNLDGTLLYANPCDMDDWVKLPVRPGDDYISTGRGFIRAPRIIISRHYDKTAVKPIKLTYSAVKRRDNYQCQYCRQKFPIEELNIDHVIPRHHGGTDAWDNLVCSCYPCNTKKGHKHNHEIGYVPLNEPVEPRPLPETFISNAKHPSWIPFMVAAK